MEKKKRGLNIVLWIVLILTPVFIVAIESVFAKVNLFLRIPQWSDEMDYWRLFYQIHENGFDYKNSNGFYGYDSVVGKFEFHGLSPILGWGPIAIILGGLNNGLVISSVVDLCLAWLCFILLLKPNIKDTIFLILVFSLYQPVTIYISTSMMEMTCYAWIIVFLGLGIKTIRTKQNNKNYILWFVLSIITTLILEIIRTPYVLLLLPVIYFLYENKKRMMIGSLGIYVVVASIVFKLSLLFNKGYPWEYLSKISESGSIKEKIYLLAKNALTNAKQYILLEDYVQSGHRWFSLVLIIFGIVVVLCFYKNKMPHLGTMTIITLSYIMEILGIVLLYDVFDWRDYRSLAPATFSFLIALYFVIGDNKKILKKYIVILSIALVYSLIFKSTVYIPKKLEVRRISVPEKLENEKESIYVGDEMDSFTLAKAIPSKLEMLYESPRVDMRNLDCKYALIKQEELPESWDDEWENIGELDHYGTLYKKK